MGMFTMPSGCRRPVTVRPLVILVTVGMVSGPFLEAQSPSEPTAAPGESVPRTPWGHPDLQGVWNNITAIPLERPQELGDRAFFTEEEAVSWATETLRRVDRDRRDGGDERDVGRAYNEFWSDRQTKYLSQLNRRTSLVIDPPDGQLPPLTPEGQSRRAARDEARDRPAIGPEDRNLWERCLTRGIPRIPGSYNNNFRVLQTPDHVVILVEMIHETRIIPLANRPHVAGGIRQWMGDSRGRWDGDTLVVETTNFTDHQEFRATSGDLRLIERFTRIDADTIDYRFTIDDPTSYVSSWTVALPMTRIEEDIFEYACHETNYGMEGILAGARAEEASPGRR